MSIKLCKTMQIVAPMFLHPIQFRSKDIKVFQGSTWKLDTVKSIMYTLQNDNDKMLQISCKSCGCTLMWCKSWSPAYDWSVFVSDEITKTIL